MCSACPEQIIEKENSKTEIESLNSKYSKALNKSFLYCGTNDVIG